MPALKDNTINLMIIESKFCEESDELPLISIPLYINSIPISQSGVGGLKFIQDRVFITRIIIRL